MRTCATLLIAVALLLHSAGAQQRGEPGRFDFYLMEISWPPEFCSIQDTSPQCAAPPAFVLHGLWPENYDGTYPVFCDPDRPGPANPERNLDITPDLSLLDHEWKKHGTCTTLAPDAFFSLERKAFHSLAIPPFFSHLGHEIEMKPAEILTHLSKANPAIPADGILVICENRRFTAIEACLAKDTLKPISCENLTECRESEVQVVPPKSR